MYSSKFCFFFFHSNGSVVVSFLANYRDNGTDLATAVKQALIDAANNDHFGNFAVDINSISIEGKFNISFKGMGHSFLGEMILVWKQFISSYQNLHQTERTYFQILTLIYPLERPTNDSEVVSL